MQAGNKRNYQQVSIIITWLDITNAHTPQTNECRNIATDYTPNIRSVIANQELVGVFVHMHVHLYTKRNTT